MADDDAGGKGAIRSVDAVVDKARGKAADALDAALAVMARPARNSGPKLAAAKLVLETAGVNAALRDALKLELLAQLKGKVSASAWDEVVGAITGQPKDVELPARGEARGDPEAGERSGG